MPRAFDIEESEPEEQKRDMEFTLGPVMLLSILCGLLLLCGLFFELGYRSGRRSAMASVAITQTSAGQTLIAPAGSNALSKPPAKGLVPATPPAQVVVPTQQSAPLGSSTEAPASNALTSYASSVPSALAGQPQVRPALPASGNGTQPSATPVANYPVQPALTHSAGVMVQIAAVSHVEDASVLMNALRKRGYAVVARREFSDNLIHVQLGPFTNRSDAVTMSQKLLGDGYNAQVIP
jgi:cell division septation protein DedD